MKLLSEHFGKKANLPILGFFLFSLLVCSCNLETGVFEKNVTIPRHQWESGFKPEITFSIDDTAALYNVYIVLRHTDAYNFNNIWIRATVQEPGSSLTKNQQYDLSLATNDKGWLGSAMDDIYETRLLIQPQTKFTKPGEYHFILEQLMREDPLKNVLNTGIRVEKIR
ncbi:MAG TPA: gliding motility lipoprotein GldH [Puia sp.]|nr:gliding motility lipoprotein GldH [Puia sp.]